ncbi:acyltransferase domain-containing protein [Variovorax saccharolyticus]|uniref:acyltransferase domain-containing protein n=1 Tax=Variovorax saccharolyticus TaxID=3053516 RepID=UPI0025790317|nr:acyltransferase domain-containing protein [Variovorax sp. J22R187]MDM0022812.1 acyltransferase domain-containing protein [Variovorax sp. J22R187]
MTLAILCSGQGRQHSNMFALTADAPEASGLFSRGAFLLGGRDPRELVKTESPEGLHQNRVGQILCALQALAAAAALRCSIHGRFIVAGYSVGEMAAWGVAGLIEANMVLDLVRQRADAMDAASPRDDGLLFVRGLSQLSVCALCARHDVAIAIINPGDAFVLGGRLSALRSLSDEVKGMSGTRVVDLPIEVASHTPRLAMASAEFRKILRATPVAFPSDLRTRLLSGIDGAPVLDAQTGKDKLADQISQTLHWAECLQGCIEGGANKFLELGPGSALSDMVAGAYPGVSTRSLDEFKTLQGARAWLSST